MHCPIQNTKRRVGLTSAVTIIDIIRLDQATFVLIGQLFESAMLFCNGLLKWKRQGKSRGISLTMGVRDFYDFFIVSSLILLEFFCHS